MSRHLLLALSATLAACVVVDTGELTISPEGKLWADGAVSLTVNGPCERVAFELDGEPLTGAFKANAPISVPIPTKVPDGDHVLRVRALDGNVSRMVSREVAVARRSGLFIEAITPPPGVYAAGDPVADAPLDLQVRFARPIVAARVGPRSVFLENEASTVSVLADGRTLRVTGSVPLYATGRASLVVAADLIEPPAPKDWQLTWTRAPGAPQSISWQTRSQVTNGAVDVAVSVAPVVGWVDLYAGALPLGRAGPENGWTVRWDTTMAPEGVYPLRAVAPGPWEFSVAVPPKITVDRTPPAVISCGPGERPSWPRRSQCVELSLTEYAHLSDATLSYGGETRASLIESMKVCPAGPGEAPLWPSRQVDVTATDSAGNGARLSCVEEIPLFGDQHPPLPSGPFAEVEADLGWGCVYDYTNTLGDTGLAAVRGEGAPDVGRLYQWTEASRGVFNAPVARSAAGELVSELQGRAWVARSDGGPGRVMAHDPVAVRGPLNRDVLRDARDVTSAVGWWSSQAWSEETAEGRVIVVDGHPDPPSPPPGGSAERPALSFDMPSFAPVMWLAWLERPAGGTARIRAAGYGGGTWTPLDTVQNFDPTREAADPAAWAWGGQKAVSWVEDGQGHVRFSEADDQFGPASLVNTSAAHAARAPAFDPYARIPVLYWIERTPGGDDVLRARRWDGTKWALVPVAVNEGLPGRILDYSARGGVIAWVDGSGELHLRITDCF